MDSDKTTPPEGDAASDTSQQAPADALSRTPDDLEAEQAAGPQPATTTPEEKKISPVKRFLRKVNIYLLIFILILVIVYPLLIVKIGFNASSLFNIFIYLLVLLFKVFFILLLNLTSICFKLL